MNGFRGTSTREIADRAGVAEVLLFRNFGTKAELYSTAVVLPLTEFFENWLTSNAWDHLKVGPEERMREFVSQLYRIAKKNRGAFVSYLAMSVFEPEIVAGLEHSQDLNALIDQLADRAIQYQAVAGIEAQGNSRIASRAVIGLILAMALFGELGYGGRATSDEIIDEMTHMILHGGLHRSQKSVRRSPAPKANGPRQKSKLTKKR